MSDDHPLELLTANHAHDDHDSDDLRLIPANWTRRKKIATTITSASMVFAVTFASSAFAPAVSQAALAFHASSTVITLAVTLFVAGFAIGPLVFAPLSELVGHLPPLMIGIVGCTVLQVPLALADSTAAILLSRFFAGAFGGGVMSVASGMLAELYSPLYLGVAVGVTAMMTSLGSVVAPVVESYVVEAAGWRWTGWSTLILCAAVGVQALLLLRETSTRVLRRRKENRSGAPPVTGLVRKYFARPVVMFVREPILVTITTYLTLTYGTLYLSFQLFPFAFLRRDWSSSASHLPLLSVALGVISAWACFSVVTLSWYKNRLRASPGATPEDRLPCMIVGAVMLPPSLIWFGWSGNVHWMSQIMACYFAGMALALIFTAGIVYIVDVYKDSPSSAVSIHIVVRSVVAASFPIWSRPMYERLDVEWASTLIAGVALLLAPAPFVFYKYGARIRGWSRYAVG